MWTDKLFWPKTRGSEARCDMAHSFTSFFWRLSVKMFCTYKIFSPSESCQSPVWMNFFFFSCYLFLRSKEIQGVRRMWTEKLFRSKTHGSEARCDMVHSFTSFFSRLSVKMFCTYKMFSPSESCQLPVWMNNFFSFRFLHVICFRGQKNVLTTAHLQPTHFCL